MSQKIPQVNMSRNFHSEPDSNGYFGEYGGQFVAETLYKAVKQLQDLYQRVQSDSAFQQQIDEVLQHFVGRPSPLYYAERLSRKVGGAQIYFKREDLNHTGSHKINNCIGQILLARYSGKNRIIAETGAGQHGVATATVAARYGLECVVYMGAKDIERQKANVYRMKLLGATVVPVHDGTKTLKDALNEALRDWVTNIDNTYYLIGTVAGPHPYPQMVRNFQSVIGRELIAQCQRRWQRQPEALVACVGGGSNSIGMFHPYLNRSEVALYGVEPAGEGILTGKHAAPLSSGQYKAGVLHGNKTYLMADENGQVQDTHSIAAGLDYPGVGPEHSYLKDLGRVKYVNVDDNRALEGFQQLSRTEGIIPALESAHAVAYAMELATTMQSEQKIVVNLSGRGDKDIHTVAQIEGILDV